jgi:hypothetical protein
LSTTYVVSVILNLRCAVLSESVRTESRNVESAWAARRLSACVRGIFPGT